MPRLSLFLAVLAVLAAGCISNDDQGEDRNVDFYNNNAQRYYDGGHYLRAIRQFEKALAVEDDNETALLGRAWSYLLLGEGGVILGEKGAAENIQVAQVQFEEIADKGLGENQYKVDLGLGKVHVLLGDLYGKRAELLTDIASRRPHGDSTHLELQDARGTLKSEYAAAEAAFRRVLAYDDNPAARDNLTALIQLARLSILRSDLGGGLLFAERYLEQVRRSKELWVKSMRDYPADKALWEAKLAGAVTKEIEALDLISNAYFKLGQLELALDGLTRVIRLDPGRMDAYLNRGIVREGLGMGAEAVLDYRDFMVRATELDIGPDDRRFIEAARRLSDLEKKLGMEPTVPNDAPAESETGS